MGNPQPTHLARRSLRPLRRPCDHDQAHPRTIPPPRPVHPTQPTRYTGGAANGGPNQPSNRPTPKPPNPRSVNRLAPPSITVPNLVTNKGKPQRLLANPHHPRPLPRHPRPSPHSPSAPRLVLPHPAHHPHLADRARHQPLTKPPPHSASSPPTENQRERRTILCAVLLGAFSYLAQFKGYPYHRYPFLLFLLLLIAIDLTDALTATIAPSPQQLRPQPPKP
jgi:hypothetical protein